MSYEELRNSSKGTKYYSSNQNKQSIKKERKINFPQRYADNIFERVIDRENLALAFCKVCKGKRFRKDIK